MQYKAKISAREPKLVNNSVSPARTVHRPSISIIMAHRLRGPYKLPRRQQYALVPGSHWPYRFPPGPPFSTTQQPQIRLSTTVITPTLKADLAKEAATSGSPPLTWPHKGWDDKVVLEVVPSHRQPRTLSDWIAWRMIRACRRVTLFPATYLAFYHCLGIRC